MHALNWVSERLAGEGARKATNLLLFQFGWFACVLLQQWIAVLITGFALLVHHLVVVNQPREWLFVSGVAALGIGFDSILSGAGVLNLGDGGILVPVWLCCLWLLFATTLNHGLGWLKERLVLAAGLGAVFGPASYLAGAQLTAASLGEPVAVSLAVMAGFWALLLPSALHLSRNFVEG